MKKIVLLASVLSVLAGTAYANTTSNTGAIAVSGTVPTAYSISASAASASITTALTTALGSTPVLAAGDLATDITVSAYANTDDFKISYTLVGSGATGTTGALSHATAANGSVTNFATDITINSIKIGAITVASGATGYSTATANEMLSTAGATLTLVASTSTSPLVAGNYTGNLTITLDDSEA